MPALNAAEGDAWRYTMNRSIRNKGLAGLAAATLLLGAAACSSDDDDAADETPTTTAAAPTTTADEMADGEMTETIVDIAAGNEDFTTLVELVVAADLAETLSGEGPFTVFAPTNDAFAAVPAEVLEGLGADTDALTAVLTYHVVAGKVMAADLEDGQEVETVQGGILTVSIDGDTVTLTDAAGQVITISAVDIEASNGVIHVIDGVLLPGDPAELLGS